MKNFMIKIKSIVFWATCILGGCSAIFDEELRDFPFIFQIRIIILIFAILTVISGVISLISNTKKKID